MVNSYLILGVKKSPPCHMCENENRKTNYEAFFRQKSDCGARNEQKWSVI